MEPFYKLFNCACGCGKCEAPKDKEGNTVIANEDDDYETLDNSGTSDWAKKCWESRHDSTEPSTDKLPNAKIVNDEEEDNGEEMDNRASAKTAAKPTAEIGRAHV
mgnify:FL=1